MAILMRRGADADFDASKIQSGELAVTTDGTEKIYVGFAKGKAKELVKKETFEAEIGQLSEQIKNTPSQTLDVICTKHNDASGETHSHNLIDDYEKQNKVISVANGKLNFYDNDAQRTVKIPLDASQYTKYTLTSNYEYGTVCRRALLDKSGQYVADTYNTSNVNDSLIEIDPNLYGYLVVCAEANVFPQLVVQGISATTTKEYYELKENVSVNFDSFGNYLFNSPLNLVKDKKIGILGDSITYGTGTTKKWWEYATERYGFDSVQVNAEVGRSFARNGMSSTRFTEKVTELDMDCDVVIVFGGVNDYQFSTPIGTIDDASTNANGAETAVTFYGAVKYVMEYLTTNFVNSRIVFFTPLPKNDNDTFNETNTAGHKVSDYADALKKAAHAYGIDVVDLNAVGGFYLYNPTWVASNMPDGLHPNANGTKVYTANGIFPALDKMFIWMK